MKEKIIVSACLLGENCRYDGKDNRMETLLVYLKDKDVIPICPEVWGGLPTPRIPSEIKGNQVVNALGEDVSEAFYKGACRALETAQKYHVKTAILKSKSPSCGLGKIYDGTFSRTLIDGHGVCVQMLLNAGIHVISSEEFK